MTTLIAFNCPSFNLIRPICIVTSFSLFSFFTFFTDLLTNLELRSFLFLSLYSSNVSIVLSSSFTPFVNPQTSQNLASAMNLAPQPAQNMPSSFFLHELAKGAREKMRGKCLADQWNRGVRESAHVTFFRFFVCSCHFFVCSIHFFICNDHFFYSQRSLFCLQRSLFYLQHVFYLQRSLFFFAAIIFSLQRFFFFAASPLWAIVEWTEVRTIEYRILCDILAKFSRFETPTKRTGDYLLLAWDWSMSWNTKI